MENPVKGLRGEVPHVVKPCIQRFTRHPEHRRDFFMRFGVIHQHLRLAVIYILQRVLEVSQKHIVAREFFRRFFRNGAVFGKGCEHRKRRAAS